MRRRAIINPGITLHEHVALAERGLAQSDNFEMSSGASTNSL